MFVLINGAILLRVNPAVIAARAKWNAGTKRYEYVTTAPTSLAIFALPEITGLEAVRFGPPQFGVAGIVTGIVLLHSAIQNPCIS